MVDMEEISNKTRAGFASVGIAAYSQNKLAHEKDESMETVIIDFLADLRHYCKQNGLHFERMSNLSLHHFTVESDK